MSGINISQRILTQSNKVIKEQMSILTERINSIEAIKKNQDNLINDLARKQEKSKINIIDNISKIDDKIYKFLNILSIKQNINNNDKSEHEYEHYKQIDSDEEDIIYEIPKKKIK